MPDDHSAEFKTCLETLDVNQARRLWRAVFPKLPPMHDDHSVLVVLHVARTKVPIIDERLRFYSHCWLRDRDISDASQLPDWLKPRAERMYPRIAEGVGIAVRYTSPMMKPIADLVRGAMEYAVNEAYADRRTEPAHVRRRMNEARARTIKKLVGKL